jgi:lipocalin-like protein
VPVGGFIHFDRPFTGQRLDAVPAPKERSFRFKGGHDMNRRCILRLSAMTALAVALLPSNGISQQKSLKDQLVGTWTFISSTTKLPDGSSVWGSNPKGLVIFTENGRYSSHVVRSDRPKFASNSREKGTPEENKAAVAGGIASFGTYTVDEANKTFTIRCDRRG